jgi:pyruvate-formate lyase-activating enzyme
VGEEIFLARFCPVHGERSERLSSDAAGWADLDRFYFQVNREPAPQRDWIVRLTERCNLRCPICLASANSRSTPDLDLASLDRLRGARLKIDLMAAEPTLRADLPAWIAAIRRRGHVSALHTNGLKLTDRAYLQTLVDAGLDEVYLQFDGFGPAADRALRGRVLTKSRLQALDNLRQLGVPTSLVAVIARGLNERAISDVVRFALRPENNIVKEVMFIGLRPLGHARQGFDPKVLMPDDLVARYCADLGIPPVDVRRFNKVYFALLSALRVRKCRYVLHTLLVRDGAGGSVGCSDVIDLARAEEAAEIYARTWEASPQNARWTLLARLGTTVRAGRLLGDLFRLEQLLAHGVELRRIPRRALLVGFATACDPWSYDASVTAHCGKGELSADLGLLDSGADANVARERPTPTAAGA